MVVRKTGQRPENDRFYQTAETWRIDRKDVATGSEDFWFWARLWRRRRFEKPCNGAETKPKTKKTAAVRPISSHRYRFYGYALNLIRVKHRKGFGKDFRWATG